MKKNTILLLIALFSFGTLFSANRDSNEAYRLAQDFFNKTSKNTGLKKAPSTTNSVQLVYSKTKKNELSTNYYYIFNQANNQGFVIVSGDENATEILAYSDESSFDPQDIPDNMKYWLSVYENEMDNSKTTNLQKNKAEIPKPTKVKSASENILTSVSPLLGGIKWNQDSPFNNLCPIINNSTNERAVAGCVATGMAQVMKYYQWPVTGTGSNSYTTSTKHIPLSLNFSQTTFDWANMTETYNGSSSAAQKNAVATLMYNCGVSVNMDYAESSGAASTASAKALVNKFGYDPNIQHIDRRYYTRDEWKSIIKDELSAARPVLYGGDDGTSGHFFVCDGYDNNDFFHFNWGWGGLSNGYFRISALDPSAQGIGGGTGGYNNSQIMIIGIQKPSPTSLPKYIICTDDNISYPATPVARNANFMLKVNSIYNYGMNSFSGKIGLALFDNNNTYLAEIKNTNDITLNSGSGFPTLTFSNINIANQVINGNYKIFCVYKATPENDWQIVRTNVGIPNYINLIVSSNFIYFSTPTNESPALQLNSLTQTGNLYSNKIGRINANITNNGKEYNSFIKIKLHSTTDNNISQLISSKNINITAGETRELNFNDSIKLPAGTYYLSTWYSPTNDPNANMFVQLGNNTPVTVLATPTGDPILTLNSKISFPDPTKVDKSMAVLSAQITNTGALFDKKMIAFIFPKAGGTSLTYIGHQDVIIDQNETKTVTFQGAIDLPLNDYFVAIYYETSPNNFTAIIPTNFSKLDFTLVETPAGPSKATQTITFADFPAYTFGASPITLSASANSGLTVTYASSDPTVASIVGNILTINSGGQCYITASAAGDANYHAASPVQKLLTVNKANQTVTFNAITDKNYGDAAFNLSASASTSLPVSFSSSVPTKLVIAGTAATIAGAGTYTVTATQAGNNNYNSATATRTLTVNKAALIATADDKTRLYGDANPVFTTTFSGFVNGDSKTELTAIPVISTTANTSSAVGTFNIVLSAVTDANYTLTYKNGTLTVNKATLSVTAENKTKEYSEVNPTLTLTYAGFKNSETSNVLTTQPTLSTTALTTSNAGSYNINVSGGSAANYTLVYTAGQLTVTKATLTVTAENKTKEYGEANPTLTLTYAGFKNSESSNVLTTQPTLSTTALTTSNAGSYNITVSGGSATNYTMSYNTGQLSITKAPLTVTANSLSKEYGEANPTFTVNYSGFKNSQTESVLSILPTMACLAQTMSVTGQYDIIPSSSSATNYSFNYVNGKLTITKAPLMISAKNDTINVGANPPSFTLIYSGFKGTDNVSRLENLPTFSCAATASSAIGSNAITLQGGSDKNYSYTLKNGVLVIKDITGFSDINSYNTLLYPNPTMDRIKIQSDMHISKVEIISANGQLMLVKLANDINIIDLSGLVEGSYFVRLFGNSGIVTKMIIKK